MDENGKAICRLVIYCCHWREVVQKMFSVTLTWTFGQHEQIVLLFLSLTSISTNLTFVINVIGQHY